MAPLQPNVVSVNLKQMSIRYRNLCTLLPIFPLIFSVGAYGSGRIDSVTVDTPMDIKTAYFSMEVAIRVNRNNRGNPHLQVRSFRNRKKTTLGGKMPSPAENAGYRSGCQGSDAGNWGEIGGKSDSNKKLEYWDCKRGPEAIIYSIELSKY